MVIYYYRSPLTGCYDSMLLYFGIGTSRFMLYIIIWIFPSGFHIKIKITTSLPCQMFFRNPLKPVYSNLQAVSFCFLIRHMIENYLPALIELYNVLLVNVLGANQFMKEKVYILCGHRTSR